MIGAYCTENGKMIMTLEMVVDGGLMKSLALMPKMHHSSIEIIVF